MFILSPSVRLIKGLFTAVVLSSTLDVYAEINF